VRISPSAFECGGGLSKVSMFLGSTGILFTIAQHLTPAYVQVAQSQPEGRAMTKSWRR
jgi:hypothetical protein